jgi:hypothetical protein
MIIPLMEKEMIVEGTIWRIRRQRRYCRPKRRFYQKVF